MEAPSAMPAIIARPSPTSLRSTRRRRRAFVEIARDGASETSGVRPCGRPRGLAQGGRRSGLDTAGIRVGGDIDEADREDLTVWRPAVSDAPELTNRRMRKKIPG